MGGWRGDAPGAVAAHVVSCVRMPCPDGQRLVAFPWGDLNPLKWLGSGVSAALGGLWMAAMTALWSAAMWLLGLALRVVDAFTTPDLSVHGPMVNVFPITFGLGLFVATLLALVQIGVAAFRRDGQSIARVLVGVLQFGAVWVGYLGCAAAVVLAASGLTRGLLQGLLHINSFSQWTTLAGSWPRQVDDLVVATVLGLCSILLVVPAAIGYVLIMLVREAALMVLAATSAITAAGLLAEATRVWFWKSLRWFVAATLIAPVSALVLGVGVQISQGTLSGAGDQTAAAVGMAVVGGVLILLGATSPLVLFRLLAFVDPGTTSGAAVRQAFASHGGVAGVLGGTTRAAHGSAAATDRSGRAMGEAVADTQTAGRFAHAMGGARAASGRAVAALRSGALTERITAVGSDVLAGAGVGHQAPYYGQHDSRSAAPGGATEPTDHGNGQRSTEPAWGDLPPTVPPSPALPSPDPGADGADTRPPTPALSPADPPTMPAPRRPPRRNAADGSRREPGDGQPT